MEWFLACLGRAIDGAQTIVAAVLQKARFWQVERRILARNPGAGRSTSYSLGDWQPSWPQMLDEWRHAVIPEQPFLDARTRRRSRPPRR